MSLPKSEAARVVQLSPSQEAVLRGPGRVTLHRGASTWTVNERESRALVLGWLAFEEARRPGSLDALYALLRPDPAGTTAS